MKNFNFIFLIVALFNYFKSIKAGNHYYICSIQKNENDENYDKASESVRQAIDELVNDRMNEIYDIIEENQDTYIAQNGQIDEKLDELEINSLNKRADGKKVIKKFINRNRPQNKRKRSESDEEVVEIQSDLVSHLCPINNYYAINVYLSDDIVDKVRQVPNVIDCVKTGTLNAFSVIRRDDSEKYYDLEAIQKETNWKKVAVQEIPEDENNEFTRLALISQLPFNRDFTKTFDRNYYYPDSAGKGVDIYVIDDGIWTDHEDFDTYKGTEDERTITCDGKFSNGVLVEFDKNECSFNNTVPAHGIAVSSAAAGKKYGVAKKANIHVLAVALDSTSNVLAAFDHIIQHGRPHKTIINISLGGWDEYNVDFQNKINELVDAGFIIFVASGNDGIDGCHTFEHENVTYFNYFTMFDNIIAVGAMEDSANIFGIPYHEASYTDYGDCVDIHAPGDGYFAGFNDRTDIHGKVLLKGTSFASPTAAGVAALIMGENSDIEYNHELMEKAIIDLSIKDVILRMLDDTTPNRYLNNGKRIVFSPDKVYNGCGAHSGNAKCPENYCCSKYGQCIDPYKDTSELCLVENGCQSEFGMCPDDLTPYKSDDNGGEEEEENKNVLTPGINCKLHSQFEGINGIEVEYLNSETEKQQNCILADIDIPDLDKINKINAILYCGNKFSSESSDGFNPELTITEDVNSVEIDHVYSIKFVSKDERELIYTDNIQTSLYFLANNVPPFFQDDNTDEMLFGNREDFNEGEIECTHTITPIKNKEDLAEVCITEDHLQKVKALLGITDEIITNPTKTAANSEPTGSKPSQTSDNSKPKETSAPDNKPNTTPAGDNSKPTTTNSSASPTNNANNADKPKDEDNGTTTNKISKIVIGFFTVFTILINFF